MNISWYIYIYVYYIYIYVFLYIYIHDIFMAIDAYMKKWSWKASQGPLELRCSSVAFLPWALQIFGALGAQWCHSRLCSAGVSWLAVKGIVILSCCFWKSLCYATYENLRIDCSQHKLIHYTQQLLVFYFESPAVRGRHVASSTWHRCKRLQALLGSALDIDVLGRSLCQTSHVSHPQSCCSEVGRWQKVLPPMMLLCKPP